MLNKEPEYMKKYKIEKAKQLKEAEKFRASRKQEDYESGRAQRDNERRQALRRQLNLLQRGDI